MHSRPGKPQGRGKIERFFATVRIQFLVEVEARGVADLAELNRLFTAWVETVYHRRSHTETGLAPLERLAGTPAPALPTREQLHEDFLWSETRTVTKTATISLHGNTFEVDAALVGHRVEVVFDPFAMASVEIRFQGRSMGAGLPHKISRHSHPKARPDTHAPPAPVTGIDCDDVPEGCPQVVVDKSRAACGSFQQMRRERTNAIMPPWWSQAESDPGNRPASCPEVDLSTRRCGHHRHDQPDEQ